MDHIADSAYHWITLVVVPLLIFFARIVDVSIGTMRVIFISKGYKLFAAVFGFFEVLIWIVAITQIMRHLTNPIYYIAYAAGFATGNYVGMIIEERLALGNILLRVITKNEMVELTDWLKTKGFGVTEVIGHGLYGTVNILFTIIPRAELNDVVASIQRINPQAFYTVEDIRFVNESGLAHGPGTKRRRRTRPFRRPLRKGK